MLLQKPGAELYSHNKKDLHECIYGLELEHQEICYNTFFYNFFHMLVSTVNPSLLLCSRYSQTMTVTAIYVTLYFVFMNIKNNLSWLCTTSVPGLFQRYEVYRSSMQAHAWR